MKITCRERSAVRPADKISETGVAPRRVDEGMSTLIGNAALTTLLNSTKELAPHGPLTSSVRPDSDFRGALQSRRCRALGHSPFGFSSILCICVRKTRVRRVGIRRVCKISEELTGSRSQDGRCESSRKGEEEEEGS